MSSEELLLAHDPYEKFIRSEAKAKNLIANDRTSKFSRKFKAFVNDMKIKKTYFIYGGMQGFAIGCLAGFGIGCLTAYQSKRLIVIPLSMLGSGLFFSCVMAFGSLIRSADHEYMSQNESKEMEE